MATEKAGDIFKPGDLLNNTYRIEMILGRGGTSEVYKARSEISGRVMAIKALRAEFSINDDFLALMTREEDIRDVRHDAIVRYFDTQRMPDGVVYLVMDFIDGIGLDRKLADGGMSADDLMIVGERVCEGLIAAHNRKIVHRDLSPDNIILRNDIPSEAVIIDFGIAKDSNPGAETIVGNEFAGKYAYAAPEQLGGRTDQRSDIYSLGALLLSTFRGEKPDMGRNPMEVVEKKKQPLNLEGVPDPLRSVIARMSDPEPDQRFASAEELLAAFRNPSSIVGPAQTPKIDETDELDDATVIVAAGTAASSVKPIGIPAAKAKPQQVQDKKRSAMGPVVALVAVAGIGAGGYFSGVFDSLLGPNYPVAEPYTLVVQKQLGSDAQAVGYVPSPEVETALSDQVAQLGGSAELTLATGDISDEWAAGLLDVMAQAGNLEEFRLVIQDNDLRLTGLAETRDEKSAIEAAFSSGFPGGLNGSLDIQLGPRFVMPEDLEQVLRYHENCGRLRLLNSPPLGFGLEDQVVVTGRFASAEARGVVKDAVTALTGDRPVSVEGEILNETLCQIDGILPQIASGGFDLRTGFGDRPGENPTGFYKVGDNPTIDVRLPKGVDTGFLWVSVVDVKGVVFHLLPNRIRPDNKIETLRSQADADGYVRLAYGLEEAQGTGRIAFTVDDTVLGKSRIVVLWSDQPLFDELRPTTESVSGYAEALQKVRDTRGFHVNSIDSAVLTTER